MGNEMMVLYFTAASLGFMHTLFGPDHYLPFTVMSKARNWTLQKTAFITAICGLGHIMSSVVLGFIGIWVGIEIMKLEMFEAFRKNFAGWALIGFGVMYFTWGVWKAIKNRPHRHIHIHEDSNEHAHVHTHEKRHVHVHGEEKKSIAPWILFTIFVFGPCEPLIPILMYPAAKNNMAGVFMAAGIFGVVTISTMLTIVMITSFGVKYIPLRGLERYSHALAGAAICMCGMAIQFLGL